MFKLEIQARLVLMNWDWELSYIHACELKVPEFSCQLDDLILAGDLTLSILSKYLTVTSPIWT